MATARFYRPDKNPEQAEFPGVPLRDIEQEEWDLLPPWLQTSVDVSGVYQKTKPAVHANTPALPDAAKET